MDKKIFLSKFVIEDKESVASIYDKYMLSYKTGRETYTTEFYPPNIWSRIVNLNLDVSVSLDGFFNLSDRRIIVFNKEEYFYPPYTILKITNKSKFHNLLHSDYLGAIMSLGIKRSKFGDLVIKDNVAYVPVINEIKDYIIGNLETIGKAPCEVEFLEYGQATELELTPALENINAIPTSMRIDCIASSVTNLSRGDCESYIKQGKIMVNYSEVYEKSKEVKLGDTVTIRGYGKYIVFSKIGLTSSGRIKLNIKKYK